MDALLKDFATVNCVFWTATKLEPNSVTRFKEYAAKKYRFIAQVEHGSNGTNEHLHFLMMDGPKETYNARTTLKGVLFPEDVKNGVKITEIRLRAVKVTTHLAFLHYCDYMLKESASYEYKSDALPAIDEIKACVAQHKEEIVKQMEGFSHLSTRKEQHAASACSRYRILCEKYKLSLKDYVDLFHALEADGIDTMWLIKDKFILFEYISLKTQRKEWSRARIHQQMRNHGFLEDVKSATVTHCDSTVRNHEMVGYSVGRHTPVADFFLATNIKDEAHGLSQAQEVQHLPETETWWQSEIDETQPCPSQSRAGKPRITKSI